MTSMLWRVIVAVGFSVVLGLVAEVRAVGAADVQAASVPAVKAAFLYNFAKFAEWPADALAPRQRLVLCVAGDAAVADALEQTVNGRVHDGRELAVQVVGADSALRSCHLLYVDGRDPAFVRRVIDTLNGTPVLTVGDHPRFAEDGGIAQLIVEDGRMRFAINAAAAKRARVNLSSKLLVLAQLVKDRRHEP